MIFCSATTGINCARDWTLVVLACLLVPIVAAQVRSGTTPTRQADASSLLISPGDTIRVNILDTPDLSGEFRISGAGAATLPLVGDLALSGHTEQEAAALINNAYQNGKIVLHPNATVFITAYSERGITVAGEVSKPGIYAVSGSRRLLDMIALAGGFTPLADTEVYIQSPEGTSKVFELPPDKAKMALENSPRVAPGDKIFVERAGTVYVLGAVGKPGTYVMQHNGQLTVLQALAEAGGSTRIAGENHAVLLRRGANYKPEPLLLHEMYKGKRPDILLLSQDVIYVPSSVGKDFVANLPQIMGTLAGAAIYSVNVSR